MITAAVTAAVAAILSFFGISPGPYLIVVAGVVKGLLVVGGLLLARRLMRKRQAAQAAQPPAAPKPDLPVSGDRGP